MDQSLKQFFIPASNILKQYHTTIAIVVIALVMILAIFRLYQVVSISTETGVEGYMPTPKANASFDEKTIDRIDGLKSSAEDRPPLQFPARQSPFVE